MGTNGSTSGESSHEHEAWAINIGGLRHQPPKPPGSPRKVRRLQRSNRERITNEQLDTEPFFIEGCMKCTAAFVIEECANTLLAVRGIAR